MKNLIIVLALGIAVAQVKGNPLSNEREGKIVGGEESIPHSHPFIISLQRSSHSCGGTIVNQNFIITAAHCVQADPSVFTVVAGEHDLRVEEGQEQRVKVDKIIVHPNYNSLNSRNDIALMRVTPPFEFNENVTAGNLAPARYTPVGDLQAIGWGTLVEGGSIPDRLQEVTVPLVTDAACRAAYLLVNYIYETMICAGEAGKDACQGDSGGPLVNTDSNGTVYLVGLTSFGVGCARPRYPGVYTEVSFFQDWIEESIAANSP